MDRIIHITDMAEILHNCGLDAYQYPHNRSGEDWMAYRERIATELLDRFRISKKPPEE